MLELCVCGDFFFPLIGRRRNPPGHHSQFVVAGKKLILRIRITDLGEELWIAAAWVIIVSLFRPRRVSGDCRGEGEGQKEFKKGSRRFDRRLGKEWNTTVGALARRHLVSAPERARPRSRAEWP